MTMKRTLLALGLAAAFVIVGAPSCEPSMTISAVPSTGCWSGVVEGQVTPANATAKVVLQRTVGGKWVDWKWYRTQVDTTKRILSDVPNDEGVYVIQFTRQHESGAQWSGTLHLRVRSNAGYIGPSWYAKIPADCPT